jgi:hypothetical protein
LKIAKTLIECSYCKTEFEKWNYRIESENYCSKHCSNKRRVWKRKPIEFEVNDNGCFICTSHPLNDGYCTISINGKSKRLHRFIYESCFGLIPKGLSVRHRCDTPTCINPEHLELGTHLDNMRDKVERKRNRTKYNIDMKELYLDFEKGLLSNKELAVKYGTNNILIGAHRYRLKKGLVKIR